MVPVSFHLQLIRSALQIIHAKCNLYFTSTPSNSKCKFKYSMKTMEKFTIQNGHLTIVTSNNKKCDETILI